jgi:ketosteroid isomerase-like protein
MTDSERSEIVAAFRRAYEQQDFAAARDLMADDFRFTSPQDDHIDKAAWLERCFPTVDHFASTRILQLVDAGDVVLLRYEYELHDGDRYRNTEAITVQDGKVADVEVYFGGKL